MSSGAVQVASALTELAALDRPTLAHRWEKAFDVPAPKSCQATLLRSALAWHIQSELDRSARDRAAKALNRAAQSPAASALSPGTRLVREWLGATHHVTVVDGGFDYAGQHWTSLSAIARSITGTQWSGPLFFGLRK